MKIRNFIIEIKDGEIVWKSDDHFAMYQNYLRQFFDGEYRLCIEDKKEARSGQQNNYYWLYLGVISEDTGYATTELHNWAKGKFLTEDITEIFGDKVRKVKTTTKLRKGEFIEYLQKIELETQVPLPDTTAYFGYSYHK